MMTDMTTVLPTFLLVALSVASGLTAVFLPAMQARSRRVLRLRQLGLAGQAWARPDTSGEDGRQKRAIEKAIRALEEEGDDRRMSRDRLSVARLLREAGLDWSIRRFWGLSLSVAGIAYLVLIAGAGLSPMLALCLAAGAGVILPRLAVTSIRSRRLGKFSDAFPDAIDVLVRGVRAGRPLGDCLAIVSSDSPEPIRSEFLVAVQDQSMGLPLDDVCRRLAERVPLQEVNFLAIVVSVQSRSGGNLTEALENLSAVLRARKQLRAKVKAMSAEAKASAGIIGSLPLLVIALVQVTSPDYIAPLFTTDLGRVVLVGSAVWMSLGILTMRQMIRFEV